MVNLIAWNQAEGQLGCLRACCVLMSLFILQAKPPKGKPEATA